MSVLIRVALVYFIVKLHLRSLSGVEVSISTKTIFVAPHISTSSMSYVVVS